MNAFKVISDFRPDAIIIGYWKQIIDIGQNDEIYPVELWTMAPGR